MRAALRATLMSVFAASATSFEVPPAATASFSVALASFSAAAARRVS
jgi:hypothetical protein